MSAISASNLTKRYGKKSAVENVSFNIEQGEIVGFLGPNGAGKTTTLRMLAGLIRPTKGHATILGQPTPGYTLQEVGTMIEEPSFYPYLTGFANLKYAALLHGGVDDAQIDEMLEFVSMDKARDKKVKAYSQGMRQRLGLARALLYKPQVLLLDEPTNGLDPVGIAEIRENLRHTASQGRTILISSHILAELEKLVDRVLVIERGNLLYDGSLNSLTKHLDEDTVTYHLLVARASLAILESNLNTSGYTYELGKNLPAEEQNLDTSSEAAPKSDFLKDTIDVKVTIPQNHISHFIPQLAKAGVVILEASLETQSLEDAYLRLLKQDGRPV